MIFFYGANGSLLKSTPERVYQGSNKANTIYFVCPTAKTNSVTIAFKLPNGDFTPQHLMRLTEELNGVYDKDGNIYSMWEFSIPSAITSYMGNVQLQFYITSLDLTISTETANFLVERGIANIKPEQENSYQELLEFTSALYPSYISAEEGIKKINETLPRLEEIALKVEVENTLAGE